MVGALEQVMTLLRRIRFCLKTVENIPQRQGDQRIFGTDARQRLQVGRTDIADITRAAEQIPAGERRGKLPFEELLPDGEIDVPKSIGTPLGRDRRPYEVGVQLNPRIFAGIEGIVPAFTRRQTGDRRRIEHGVDPLLSLSRVIIQALESPLP